MIVLGSKKLLLNHAFYKAILGFSEKNNGRLYAVLIVHGKFSDLN